MLNKILNLLAFVSILVVLIAPITSLAQGGGVSGGAGGQVTLQGNGCDDLQAQFAAYGGNQANVTEKLPKYCTAADILQFGMNVIFSLVGGLTVLFIMIGGYQYITSGGNEEQAGKGKQTVQWSAIGLAVVLMAAALINIVINLVVNDKLF